MGKKYDKTHPDTIQPIIFHDMNCCPQCGQPSLVMLDHEFDMTSINADGYIDEVLQCNMTTEIACTSCGFKTTRFVLDGTGRIKICTEAELIYEIDQKHRRNKERALKARTSVGLSSPDENPFVKAAKEEIKDVKITHF